MSYCMGPATCRSPLCQTEQGCQDFLHERKRPPDLQHELQMLIASYGGRAVVEAAIDGWLKMLPEKPCPAQPAQQPKPTHAARRDA